MSEYCELHKTHSPEPLTSERHHVTPQAWQLYKTTGDGESARKLQSMMLPSAVLLSAAQRPQMAGALYDKRTVAVAPTCHRNVHFWLVKVMKAFDELVRLNPQIEKELTLLETAVVHVRSIYHPRGRVFDTALLAPTRYLEAGGSLRDLCAQRLYGYA